MAKRVRKKEPRKRREDASRPISGERPARRCKKKKKRRGKVGHAGLEWLQLHDAIRAKDRQKVSRLLANGVDPRAEDDDYEGYTAIHEAAYCGHDEIIEILDRAYESLIGGREVVMRDGSVFDLYLDGDSELGTPLQIAVWQGFSHTVRVLLKLGASPHAGDWEDGTALHTAASMGRIRILRQLLRVLPEMEADRSWSEDLEYPIIDTPSRFEGNSPLHTAALHGQLRAAELLIEAGAQVSFQNGEGETPLHLVARDGNQSVAELLLQHGAEANATDFNATTPLDEAIASDNEALVGLIRRKGGREGRKSRKSRR